MQPSTLERNAALSKQKVLEDLQVESNSGLSSAEVEGRREKYGSNEQAAAKQQTAWQILIHQFNSTVVYLLLACAAISFFLQEYLQTGGIVAALSINALTGFFMEYRAAASLQELVKLSGTAVRTRRNGKDESVPVGDLVPGDIVLLDAGTRVPADLRLLEAASLSIDESPVTGESVPVFKCSDDSSQEWQQKVCFHGTLVAAGRGVGVVVATGGETSLGKLGRLLVDTKAGATPLEMQLEEMGQQLTWLTIVICVAVTAGGILQKQDIMHMLETGVALAVAAIPEGLPVLATLALAVGTHRMVRNRAIVRQLAAVETLGCTSIICSDKTGTLTENLMTVTRFAVAGASLQVSGNGYAPEGEVTARGGSEFTHETRKLAEELFTAAVLCNDATLQKHDSEWQIQGDPTEAALLTAAGKLGLTRAQIEQKLKRIGELPFDLSRKRMTTLHKEGDNDLCCFVKGSPEQVLEVCTTVLTGDGEVELTKEMRQWFVLKNERMAEAGLRVLAFARQMLDEEPECLDVEHIEKDLTLLGLVGMADKPKADVESAIAKCKSAGIRVLMLTGDQPTTAKAISCELGIHEVRDGELKSDGVLTGSELQSMSPAELRKGLETVSVLARVTPDIKLGVVKALQETGAIVAMTGDGVNDAPALKQANIGVAMGDKGTDLAKSVSEMVIMDDNLSTIVKAVEQGRVIYRNIQKAVGYLLTASLSAVCTVALGVLFNHGLPLNALQLLWLNLIMHIFPGLGLVLQKADPGIMSEPPRDPSRKIIGKVEMIHILLRALVVSVAVLVAIDTLTPSDASAAYKTTIGLYTLSFALLAQAWQWLAFGSGKIGRVNRAMWINMAVAYALLFAAVYMPGLTDLLETQPLDMNDLAKASGVALAFHLISLTADHLFNMWKKQQKL